MIRTDTHRATHMAPPRYADQSGIKHGPVTDAQYHAASASLHRDWTDSRAFKLVMVASLAIGSGTASAVLLYVLACEVVLPCALALSGMVS